VLVAVLLMVSAFCLLTAGALLVWPRTARRVAKYRFNVASASRWGHPYRRTLRYTQLCGLSVCALGTAMLVWSVQF
jgi:hypothetical protein